jgi:uncharacterized membrane protein YeaQ/YmgE (transglycosylase-associated protein family)
MSLESLIVLLVIAGVCGGLGSGIAGYTHAGCLGSILLGFVGAYLGLLFARELHLPELYVLHVGHRSFPVVWSIVGSAGFVAFLGFLTRRRSIW